MKPFHIAFFNRAFYPEVSATGQLLTELAEGLARDHGCRVSVVTGIPQGECDGTWRHPRGFSLVCSDSLGSVSILRARGTTFPKGIFLGRVSNYLTYFGSACLAGLRLERPDVIIALTDPPMIGLAGLLAARHFRCPLVISYRDLFPEAGRLLENVRSPFIEWALTQVNRILVRNADRLIALGEAMKKRLIHEKGASPERVVVIPDWADTNAIVPTPKRNPFSLAHGLADRFVVMHSGNLGVSQNLESLVEAACLLSDLPDLQFVFVGDGVKKKALQDLVHQKNLRNVQFLPYQPKEALSYSFGASDCFIVSLKPGLAGYIMPSKLYGILAAGRPYVAAVEESCDVSRITREYQCGLLAEPGNPRDLSQKIRILYQDRGLAQRLGINAHRASQFFDRSRGVRAYFDLCRELTRCEPVERVTHA